MNKDTFFEEFFTTRTKTDIFESSANWATDSEEENNDIGTRTLQFGINKTKNPPSNTSSSDTSSTDTDDISSIGSNYFKNIGNNYDDHEESDEIKEIMKEEETITDANVYIDWKYSPDNIKESEWEFAYKILNNMKLKEHYVKTTWVWDNNLSFCSDDFTNTLNSAIVYALVTLINPVTLQFQIYKIVCKIPKKEARKMYKLNLNIPSHDWVLRSKWSWLSCVPYKNDNEATV
tara:strand:- start:12 stop:710 length:699 start_codon:yes stop_codon:yes gene_type:complete